METIRGIAVFPGVAIGPAMVVDHEGFRIHLLHVPPEAVGSETERFDRAIAELAEEIGRNAKTVSERLGPEVAMIFEAHRRMVVDPHLRSLIVNLIQQDSCTAEYAVQRVLRKYAEFFRNLENTHFADRASDITDLERQILSHLLGERRAKLNDLDHEVVVVAHDLTPSETAAFNPKFVRGLVTEAGGRTSHTAIVAGAMQIPAVVGLGRLPTEISEGEMIIVDGNRGQVIIDPDDATLRKYKSNARDFLRFEQSLAELRDLPAETLDGVRIQLTANIEFPHEAAHCLERGSDGVGLYRTEFLYLNRSDIPSEEDHYSTYAAVVQAMGPNRPVVFRTMDLGADKFNPLTGSEAHENNPVLGLRSIRLSLRNVASFKTQLRAILRVSPMGDVRIMFPLITTLMELRRCRMILADVMEDLEEEGIEFRKSLPVGMMVEVPSAALLADNFARYVDFFSIGTNDLIQYSLAVDRTNELVASLYNASDPAVLKLLRTVVRAADRHGIEVNVCGEMSGEPIYTALLVGMGLRSLSATPHIIPEIKKIIRSITLAEARRVAARARRLDTAGDVTNFLRNRTRRIIPELIDDLS